MNDTLFPVKNSLVIYNDREIMYNNRDGERPFNIDAAKRVLYRQQCLKEYITEIENNVVFYANMGVYDELKNSYNYSTISYDIYILWNIHWISWCEHP